MKQTIQDFFYYSKRERNGVLVLCLLGVIILMMNPFLKHLQSRTHYDFHHYRTEIAHTSPTVTGEVTVPLNSVDLNSANQEVLLDIGIPRRVVQTILNFRKKGGRFYQVSDLMKIYGCTDQLFEKVAPYCLVTKKVYKSFDNKSSFNKREEGKRKSLKKEIIIRPPTKRFNPNIVSAEIWQAMGFPDKVIQTIHNFREKGGRFYKKKDLLNIYGMKAEWYDVVASYIDISTPKNTGNKQSETHIYKVDKKDFVLNVNEATVNDWKKLKGIGDVYASRIVKFREKLGGFTNIEQIKETYGLSDSTFQNIKPSLHINKNPTLQTFFINIENCYNLKKHPYINYKTMKLICAYRREHGDIDGVDKLKKLRGLKPELIEKLLPYINFGK